MKSRSLVNFLLLLLFLTSCSLHPAQSVVGITSPTETESLHVTTTATLSTTGTPTGTLTPTLVEPTPTTVFTAIPPSETPFPFPQVYFHNEYSSLPAGQYLLYWSFTETFCRLYAVSMNQEVYPVIDANCGFGPDPNQSNVLSENGLFLLVPFGQNTYLIHLADHQREILAPSQRKDCVITSVSWDGTRFAGRCGSFETSFELAVRTINSDWVILQPFEPDDQGDVTFTIAWSPDGKMLAFNKATSLTRGVYVIDVDQCLNDRSTCASQVKGLYLEDTSDYLLWSPDGKQLAVTIAREFMIYDVNSTQSWLIKIKNEGVLIHGAAWSPDGKWIGYAVDKGQNLRGVDTYIISPNGGTVSFLTDKDVIQVVGWLNIGP